MSIDAKDVMKLRNETGAPMMDCKKALADSKGDFEKAKEYLRKKGAATAEKRADKQASEGMIASYMHHNGKVGVLVELRCETDFVAKTDDFKNLGRMIAMQVASARPDCVRREEMDAALLEKEREIYKEEVKASGKPEKIWDKIIEGKLDKFYSQRCLLEQVFVQDDKKTVKDVVNEAVAKLGEKIEIHRFVRMELGAN